MRLPASVLALSLAIDAVHLGFHTQDNISNWTRPISHSLNPSVRLQLLQQFAPVIYLHPEEAYLPADPVEAYKRFLNASANELHVPKRELGGNPLKDGRLVDAPVTTQARLLEDGRVALQYWYYHHFNGPQGFKTVTSDGTVSRFPWYPLAVHYADWEHTTIILTSDGSQEPAEIESVYYTVHADINEPEHKYSVENVTHPLVFSHNNSHACYKSPKDAHNIDPAMDGFVNSAIRFITFGAIQHIEVGDIGFANYPKSEWIRWSDYEIYDISDTHEKVGPEWALWQGHWGPAFDQSQVDEPPVGVPWRRFFFDFLQIIYHAGRLTQFVSSAKLAPRGPIVHYTWYTFDVYDPPGRYVPEDPNGHKPGILPIVAFVYFLLGFVGILNVVLSLVLIGIMLLSQLLWRRSKAAYQTRRQRRKLQMSEVTPLLS
ncbi:hypothetical protein BCR37DRAFT_166368 [Protomyces lactucae-debilis]|uniref:Vacuolar protein sorting-associated protein 62 n=1 Tax=Protomyces lactucae-debilis TaxID=2754530 RepID=A0A1Y2EXS2_PROLT|nr:uncharacterized protein BCR37DRAFT_166368 [Protomyces lactucae-debilis]ORY76399.1 hypothetical protein BCR37DRAFT_166368 [Protomyces lactucae-debilis]